MTYEVVPSSTADTWVAEAIDRESEGEVYSAVFYGQKAKERAEEYASWKNAVEQPRRTVIRRASR